MKLSLPLAVAALALTAATAFAQTKLAWNDCLPPAGQGAVDKSFACDDNTLVFTLYGSVIAPPGTVAITGEQGVIDMQSAGTLLPAWWEFILSGSCRASGSLAVNFITPPPSGCMVDYFGSIGTGPLGGFGYDWGGLGSPPMNGNRARIKTVSAVDGSLAHPMIAGTENYLFTVVLKTTNTVGTGACGGCAVPVCMVFDNCVLMQTVGLPNFQITDAPGYATWQGGVLDQPGPSGGIGCPAATPTRTTTWGHVKTLYR